MVVICPKCKVKLKIPDEKISPEGGRFRCPKCNTVLLVKKPAKKAKSINKNLVLLAHSDESIHEKVVNCLRSGGYDVVTAKDGIEAMVTALRELPFVALIDVALPKIYGFEVCKRLKERPETRDIKIILITSVYDKERYKRQPSTLYGADDYIEGPDMEQILIEKINTLKEEKKAGPPTEEEQKPAPPTEEPGPPPAKPLSDEEVERARRFVRTVLSDLLFYNTDKVNETIKDGTFRETFKAQLLEGVKLYKVRVTQEVRDRGDFFNEEIDKFIEKKKKELSV